MGRALALGVFLLVVLVLMYFVVPLLLGEASKRRNRKEDK